MYIKTYTTKSILHDAAPPIRARIPPPSPTCIFFCIGLTIYIEAPKTPQNYPVFAVFRRYRYKITPSRKTPENAPKMRQPCHRRSHRRHRYDEAVDGDADSPTDGAVVACLMFPSMQRSMFRARIPAEAERKPRVKQERSKRKRPRRRCIEQRANNEKTPPRRRYRSPSEVRETHKKPPPPQRNTPSGILTKKMKKNCKIFAQFKNLCHLCSVRK